MGGVAKKGKKAFKGVADTIGGIVSKSVEASLKPVKKGIGALTPQMPDGPDAPLMPDLDQIEQSRRRKRTQKMGRTETIMSTVLG